MEDVLMKETRFRREFNTTGDKELFKKVCKMLRQDSLHPEVQLPSSKEKDEKTDISVMEEGSQGGDFDEVAEILTSLYNEIDAVIEAEFVKYKERSRNRDK